MTEDEVYEVFATSRDEYNGTGDSRMRLGQTAAGRYLQIIYVPDDPPVSGFVITAFELRGKDKRAYRRRRRRRNR